MLIAICIVAGLMVFSFSFTYASTMNNRPDFLDFAFLTSTLMLMIALTILAIVK